MRGWRFVLCTLLAALGGCFLTTSLDGLSGSPAMLMDTGVAGDGPTDAGVEPDAPAADFRCMMITPAPAFCSDFDTGSIDGTLGTPNTALGGTVAFDETTFVSRGRSLKLTTPALTAGAGIARAGVVQSFERAGRSTINVRFDMRVDSADGAEASTLALWMGDWDVTLFIGSTSRIREGVSGDGGRVFTSTDKTAPPVGRWISTSLILTLDSSSSNVVVAYEGVKQGAVPLVAHQYLASSIRVEVGFNYVARPDRGRDMHIDNLVVDIE
jgi:hypothetical protein